jgi:hypothetical protein
MKKLFMAAVFLLPFIAKAQQDGPFNYKSEDRYLYYGDVVLVDSSFTVSDLYKDAKSFITRMALSNIKIIADDEKGGNIVVSVEEPATFKTETGVGSEPMTLKYNLKLELKKGRYRYTFDNILIRYLDKDNRNEDHTLYDVDKGRGGGLLGVGRSKRILKAMDALFLQKIDLLKNTMKKKSDDF